MARHANVTVPAATITQLTADDATIATVQNLSTGDEVMLFATADATAPSDFTEGFRLLPGMMLAGLYMSELFPGIAAKRLWAYAQYRGVTVRISHD